MADDVAQETIVRLAKSRAVPPAFPCRPAWEAYVRRTAINIWRDRIKSDNRRHDREYELSGVQSRPGPARPRVQHPPVTALTMPGVDDAYITQHLVRQVLAELDEDERAIAHMLDDGLAMTEIAERLGISESKAYRKRREIQRKLRQQLEAA